MKTKNVIVIGIFLLSILAGGAWANDFGDYTAAADCEGWTAAGNLLLATDVDLNYEIQLIQGGVTVATFTGMETIYTSNPTFALGGGWGMDLCGDYSVFGLLYFYSEGGRYDELRFGAEFTCECDTLEYCNYTPGFWKNHPDAWPVENLDVGCRNYDKSALIAILETPIKHDKLLIMVHHLIAAKLNVLAGSDDSIMGAIFDADALLCSLGRILGRVDNDVKSELVCIKDYLANYNEMGCPGDEIDEFGILGSKTFGSGAESFGAEEETTWGALKKLPE